MPPLPEGHPLAAAIARDWPRTDFSRRAAPLESIRLGGPPRDGIPAIDEPSFAPAIEADLGESEPVVRLEVAGEVRAYPLRVLVWHEIVNDEVGGVPVAVTYCPLCSASVVFDRRLDGRAARFGTTGLLRNSDLVMYDDREESWWQQYGGDALVGARAGEALPILPSRITSYSAVLEEDPSMPLLEPTRRGLRPYGANPYVGYDTSRRPFLYDGALPEGIEPLAYVAAVGTRAWSLDALREAGEVDAGGGVVLRWRPGLNSALDSRLISEGRDIGRVEATRGGREVEHRVVFAFVFHAFEDAGEIIAELGAEPISWDRRPPPGDGGGEADEEEDAGE